ncbi:MAG: 2Fe-2S iron-sulfur cluster binding domain-containing protein [Cellvibrionaceae bacterium]|nr:2Fe-2S iron-sulfur cluster binding domain-containing protein [Cellvibrionaceae bacterium]
MSIIFVSDEDGDKRQIDAQVGLSLMAILRNANYYIPAICGGVCACGTCHILVHQEWIDKLPKVTDEESSLLQTLDNYHRQRSRLACQIHFTDALAKLPIYLLEN